MLLGARRRQDPVGAARRQLPAKTAIARLHTIPMRGMAACTPPPPLPRSNYSICCLIRLFFLHSNRYSKFASPGSNQLRINANACSCREAAEAPLPRRWTRNAQPSGRQLQVNQDREEAAAARAAAAVNAPAAPRRCVVCFSTVSSY